MKKIDRENAGPMKPPLGSLCPLCGPNVRVDEDGLCAACGATAMGDGADAALKAMAELATLKRKARRMLKGDYDALEHLGLLTKKDQRPEPEGDPG